MIDETNSFSFSSKKSQKTDVHKFHKVDFLFVFGAKIILNYWIWFRPWLQSLNSQTIVQTYDLNIMRGAKFCDNHISTYFTNELESNESY
jgi:hypothetical protein